MTDYLAKATTFTFSERHKRSAPGEPPGEMTIQLVRRTDEDGQHFWAVVSDNQVYCHADGIWELEFGTRHFDPRSHYRDFEEAFQEAEAQCERAARLGYSRLMHENRKRFDGLQP